MQPLPHGTSGFVAGVYLMCSACGAPVEWRQGQGFCHIGQRYGALWACPQCGYRGDLTPGQVSAGCPKCRSQRILIDHYADLRADDLRHLQAAGWDV